MRGLREHHNAKFKAKAMRIDINQDAKIIELLSRKGR